MDLIQQIKDYKSDAINYGSQTYVNLGEELDEALHIGGMVDHKVFGVIELVSRFGGEDLGSTYYNIYKFHNENKLIRLSSYYSSYEGVSWDYVFEVEEVVPREKTIITYETI